MVLMKADDDYGLPASPALQHCAFPGFTCFNFLIACIRLGLCFSVSVTCPARANLLTLTAAAL
eukprot:scaffold265846_cov14-Tisochrysis_lutea.AAC.1